MIFDINTDVFLKTITAIFVVSGFFFVPILVLAGVFNSGALKQGAHRTVFLIISLSMMVVYIFLGNGSARYLLIPLLLVGCLAGTGLEFIANLFAKISKRKNAFRSIVMAILTLIAVAMSAWRCSTHKRTECMDIFSNLILNEHTDSTVVFAVNSHTAQKLGGILNEFNDIGFYNIELWKDAIQTFIPIQANNTNSFFCVEMPKEYNLSHFKNWFQSCYYIFPFQAICECFKGSKRFILLKFNHKTLDGKEDSFSTDVLEHLPSPLKLQKWRGNISFKSFENYLSPKALSGKFVEVERGTWIGSSIYTRLQFQPKDAPISLVLRNDVFWPESICHRVLVEDEESGSHVYSFPKKDEERDFAFSAQIADPVLLELLPPSPVIVSESTAKLFCEGTIPGYYFDSDRFLLNGSEQLSLDISNSSNLHFEIEIRDRYLKTNVKKELIIKRTSPVNKSFSPVSLLLIEDQTSSDCLSLKENLSSLLPEKSEVDQIVFPVQDDWATTIRTNVGFPEKRYDTIVVNTFIDPLKRPWSLQFETDCVFDRDFSFLINKLHDTYTNARILVVLPPAPPAEPAMYTICDSTRLAKLSHYRICSTALRWHDKHHPDNLNIVPLYLFAVPGTDYTKHTTINNITIRSGYHFTPEALKRFATILGWSVIESLDNVQSFLRNE